MLRHKGVFGDMQAVDRSVEKLTVLRRYPDPVPVQFRRGGDLAAVVNAVKQHRFVEVRAAVGSGKSTAVPLLISKALGCLVIHTIPSPIAAEYLAVYLSTTDDGDKFVYVNDLESDFPRHGVVLMSNAFYHAKVAEDKFVDVSNAVLYLDESHESDAFTAVARSTGPATTNFRCVIRATATSAPGVQMTPDLPSKRDFRTYRKVDVSTWSANDRGVPWAAAGIQANVMMCIDRVATRRKLGGQYREYGFVVRDCCDEDFTYFQETMRMLKDSREGIVIVFVDYKFRSSFSIPGTGVFIDSCEVAVPVIREGMPSMQYRAAYDFEVQQFLGRGGRLPGTPVVLWSSDEAPKKLMCDLESLECDAANLLYRLLGFRPPLELAEYEYFSGDVPIDIAAAMASAHPLRLCPEESRVPWVNGHKGLQEEKKKAAYEYELTVQSRAKPVSCHTVVDVQRSYSPPPEVPRSYRRTVVDVDGLDQYRSSRESSPSAIFTIDTEYYDHLTALENMEKPKRVAKRVLEARAAEEAAAERKKAEERLSGAMTPVESNMRSVPDFPVPTTAMVEGGKAAVAATGVAFGTRPDVFGAAHEAARPMYDTLRDFEKRGPGITVGKYYHYHGMDSAPEVSSVFLRGLESVVNYCENHDSKRYIKGLPASDKLYAMKVLVDAANQSTAVVMGMQRLFQEVSSRPSEQWQAVVDHQAMMTEVEWMIARCSEEQSRVRVYHSIIPLFAKYNLEEMPAPLDLEQRVMLEVMQRFERAAVVKDPDKVQGYWQRLNNYAVAINPRLIDRFKHAGIEY